MPRRRTPDPVYVGIRKHVLALDRATGQELWRTKLEGMRVRAHDFVGLELSGDDLLASCCGELYCLDPQTGVVRWHNQLTGLGTGVVSTLAPEPEGPRSLATPPTTVAEELRRREQQRNAAAT